MNLGPAYIAIFILIVGLILEWRRAERWCTFADKTVASEQELITALHELLTDPRPETIQRAEDVLERRAMVIGWRWKK